MTFDCSPHSLPAPCIIDSGTIINKEDMRRLLNDLGRVRYIHILDGEVQSEGEGWVIEIFADAQQATLVANHALYLNVHSFDYLRLHQSPTGQTQLSLRQDNRELLLIPTSNPLENPEVPQNLNAEALEAMVTQVLAAKWDVQLDDEDDCPL